MLQLHDDCATKGEYYHAVFKAQQVDVRLYSVAW